MLFSWMAALTAARRPLSLLVGSEEALAYGRDARDRGALARRVCRSWRGAGVACGSRRVVAARNGQAGTRKYSLHLIARGPAEAEASGQPGAGAARPACAPRISFSWLGIASLSLTALTQVWGLHDRPPLSHRMSSSCHPRICRIRCLNPSTLAALSTCAAEALPVG